MQTNLHFKVAYLDHAAVLHILLTGFAVRSVRLSPDKTNIKCRAWPFGGAVVLFQGILIMICCNAEEKKKALFNSTNPSSFHSLPSFST